MDLHQPREVDWLASSRWVREACALMVRRPALYAASSALMLGIFLLFLQVENSWLRFALVLLLPPLALVGFLRLARAADCSLEFSVSALLPSNADALRVAGIALLGYGAAFAALLALGALGQQAEAGGRELAEIPWRDYLDAAAGWLGLPVALLVKTALFGASVTAFCSLLLALCAWFTLPLIQFSGLSLVPASLLSFRAYRLNARALGVMGLLVLVSALIVLLLTIGLVAVLIAPFTGALLYVSYRDVFLGQAKNAPVPAQAAHAAAAQPI